MDSGLCLYHLFIVKFIFLVEFPMDHLVHPNMSSLLLFCANLQNSLIIWLIVSSVSSHNLYLLFFASVVFLFKHSLSLWRCFVLLRDSVPLLRFPFLSHVQVFSFEISPVVASNIYTVVFVFFSFSASKLLLFCQSLYCLFLLFAVICLSLLFSV